MFTAAVSAFISGLVSRMSARQFKLIALSLVFVLYTGATFYAGHWFSDSRWEKKELAAKLAESRKTEENARSATASLSTYVKVYRDTEAAFTDILQRLNQKPEVETVTVYRNRLLPVPGMPEVVYVPLEFCPQSFLDPDDISLFNEGATRPSG